LFALKSQAILPYRDQNSLQKRISDSENGESLRFNVERVADSCGFGVPLYEYQGQRDTLIKYAEKKGTEGMEQYRQKNNRAILNGLPALA